MWIGRISGVECKKGNKAAASERGRGAVCEMNNNEENHLNNSYGLEIVRA